MDGELVGRATDQAGKRDDRGGRSDEGQQRLVRQLGTDGNGHKNQ